MVSDTFLSRFADTPNCPGVGFFVPRDEAEKLSFEQPRRSISPPLRLRAHFAKLPSEVAEAGVDLPSVTATWGRACAWKAGTATLAAVEKRAAEARAFLTDAARRERMR